MLKFKIPTVYTDIRRTDEQSGSQKQLSTATRYPDIGSTVPHMMSLSRVSDIPTYIRTEWFIGTACYNMVIGSYMKYLVPDMVSLLYC